MGEKQSYGKYGYDMYSVAKEGGDCREKKEKK